MLFCLLFDKVFGFPLCLIGGDKRKCRAPLLFLQTGSGKAFGLNKQQPLHHIAYSERWHLFPSKKNLPDSSERNKVQTLPCSIQYFGTKIYLISHLCKSCKAVARTKLLFRTQTSFDVWSLCMSMWLLLRIKITQVSHHL